MDYNPEIHDKFKLGYVYKDDIESYDKYCGPTERFKILTGVHGLYPREKNAHCGSYGLLAESLVDGSIFFFYIENLLFRCAIEDVLYNSSLKFNTELKEVICEEK